MNVTNNGDNMEVGSLVRYRKEYPDGTKKDWIGVVIDCEIDSVGRVVPHVQWSNGARQKIWLWRSDFAGVELEVICK